MNIEFALWVLRLFGTIYRHELLGVSFLFSVVVVHSHISTHPTPLLYINKYTRLFIHVWGWCGMGMVGFGFQGIMKWIGVLD